MSPTDVLHPEPSLSGHIPLASYFLSLQGSGFILGALEPSLRALSPSVSQYILLFFSYIVCCGFLPSQNTWQSANPVSIPPGFARWHHAIRYKAFK
jgi:hypothetical protein